MKLISSPWSAQKLEKRRLTIILNLLEGKEIDVIIDETGDKKKGKSTDYVKRQYIGNLGKIENGIVSVNAYGHYQGMTFPLKFKISLFCKWWQLVMSAYLMVSLHSDILNPLLTPVPEKFQLHDWWNQEKG